MRSSQSRGGFTLIELLVVIAILGLLATMLMPAVTGANDSAIKTTDANNLKQLMNMYIKHRTDTRQTWAYPAHVSPSSGTNGMTQYNGGDAAQDERVTYASFWELARKHEISPDLFNSPAGEPTVERAAGLDTSVNYKEGAETVDPQEAWSNEGIAYMLDWSCPKTAGTIRPTLSNRDHLSLFGDHINVVFADAHIGSPKDFEITEGGAVYHLAVEIGSGSTGRDDILAVETEDHVGTGSTAVDKSLFMGRGNRKRASMK